MGTCRRRFRRAFPSNRRFSGKIVAYQELFSVVTLLACKLSAITTTTGMRKLAKQKL